MINITTPTELWASSMLPEGILERWLVEDGMRVEKDQPIASVNLEGATHVILAPATGEICTTYAVNQIVEPDCLIGQIIEPHLEARALEAAFSQSLAEQAA